MPRPICFMIMAYSVKPTGAATGTGAPDKVNFDRLWEAALRPAIDKAGYEPVRANEDIGALIIHEMIERLAISDLVLADVSIPNGNVYYEVGIRHAAQKQGCILTAAQWSKPLFDIDQMRQIRYPVPIEFISDDTAGEIIKIVEAAIPIMRDGESPFYQVFPKYPEYDPVRATAFKKTLEELSRFQSEIIAARSTSGEECRARALDQPFVSADAVACYVGIERRQVMQLTRAGKLPAYPIDPEAKRKAWRYKLSEVDAMISGSRKAVGELAAAFGSRDNSEHDADGKAYRLSRGSRSRGAELERPHGARSTAAEDGGKGFAGVIRG